MSHSNLTSISGGIPRGNVTLLEDPDLCTLQTCDLTLGQLDYIPNLAGNTLYAALFGLFIIAQIGLGVRYKTWGYMTALICGLVLEIIGYAGRIMMHNNIFDHNNFLIYLICLTIAPAFLAAGIYLCLSRVVAVYGAGLSRWKPRTYTLVFCSCDFFSLLLQAIGGALASTADTDSSSQTGIDIMLAGLSFQVFSLAIFAAACADFALRVRRSPEQMNTNTTQLYHSTHWKLFLCGLGVAAITIFVRSIFRVAELSGGFDGSLANNQITFMILEGAMIVSACIALTVGHPGPAFRGLWNTMNFPLWGKQKGAPEMMEKSLNGSSLEQGSVQVSSESK